MYYGEDGSMFLEPDASAEGAYRVVFKNLNSTDGVICLGPDYDPLIIFATSSTFGRDTETMLNGVIALIEAGRTLTAAEKLTEQIFLLNRGNIYKCPDGNMQKSAEYVPFEKRAPVKIELCMN
jgi:hypothetical protein